MTINLKCMIGKWLHKGQISQEEYDAVIKKLDGHNKQIRAEAIAEMVDYFDNKSICLNSECIHMSDGCNCVRCIAEQLKEQENDNSIT